MAHARRAPLTERRDRAPAFDWSSALNLILYPLHRFYPRSAGSTYFWSTSQARLRENAMRTEADAAHPPYIVGCAVCGRLSRAPLQASAVPGDPIVTRWRCSSCDHVWQTSTEPTRGATGWPGWSGLLREKAALCLTREDGAPDEAVRMNVRRMGEGWLALAETQDWLDGRISPLPRARRPDAGVGIVASS